MEETLEKQELAVSARFLGAHTNKIDSKNRLSTPADFRKALMEEGADAPALVCCPSLTGPFLECGGPELPTTLIGIISHLDFFEEERQVLEMAILSQSQRLPFDENGRVSLPAELRAHAQLDGQATFVGIGPRFQIWAPDAYAEKMDVARKAIAASQDILKARSLPSLTSGGTPRG
jgi:MraZ protein